MGVGVTNLDLQLLGVGLDGVVVEGPDDLLASITVLEAVAMSAWIEVGGGR